MWNKTKISAEYQSDGVFWSIQKSAIESAKLIDIWIRVNFCQSYYPSLKNKFVMEQFWLWKRMLISSTFQCFILSIGHFENDKTRFSHPISLYRRLGNVLSALLLIHFLCIWGDWHAFFGLGLSPIVNLLASTRNTAVAAGRFLPYTG